MKDLQNLEYVVSELQNIGVLRLRGEIDDYKKGEDLDLYVPKEKINELKTLLEGYNFSLVLENTSKIFYKCYYNGGIVTFDILKNFDYIFDLFPKVRLTEDYIKKYLQDRESNNKSFACIRYIHMLRSDQKSIELFQNNFAEFNEKDFYLKYVNKTIFKKEPTKENITKFLTKSPYTLFKTLKLQYFLTLPYGYYKKYKIHFNNGKIVCLSGVDGVGKTTISDVLQRMTKGKYIYLGYGDTTSIFGSYFNKIQSKKTIVLIMKYAIRYLENLLLLPLILFYKISGRFVVIDRHPLLETAQLPQGLFSKISTILYKYFFYTPKNTFIIHADPQVIYDRKPEKDLEAIKIYQEKQRKYIKAHNITVHYIENNDINGTCSLIFKTIK